MITFNNKKTLFFLILGVSLLSHFAYFGQPNQTVFDEVHFGKFVSGYLAGEYFFDIHPPLGKLLFYGAATLGGFGPEFAFDNIGTTFPNNHYLALRFLPTLAGVLLPLIIFGIALKLRLSLAASFLAGILVALDNALIIQSRFILLDAFLLLFGFAAIFFYLKFSESIEQQKDRFLFLWLAGIFGALSGSIKWTGFGFLGFIVILELFRARPNFNLLKLGKERAKRALLYLFFLVAIPFLIYFSIFTVHFYLLSKSGPGDAFMSGNFQKTLLDSRYQSDPTFHSIGTFKKFAELNLQMYSANQRLAATHPYGSQWYTWPLLVRPVYFWNKAEAQNRGETAERKIYLLGNPLIWWTSTIAILLLLINFLANLWNKKYSSRKALWILGAYFLNLLPFMGVQRVMFLYHYFVPLVFAILGLAYMVDQTKKPLRLVITLTTLAVFFSLYFAPLTYGLPLTLQESAGFFWFPSWK